MTKMQGSFEDEAGKSVDSFAGKAGGELDKNELAPDAADADYASSDSGSYGSDYSDSGYDGGSSGDSSGSYGGSSDDSSDSSDGGTGEPDDDAGGGDGAGGGSGDDQSDSEPDSDDSLYAEGESDGDTGGDHNIGNPDEGELDHDNDDTNTEPITPEVPRNKVSIDVEGMARLVAGMERAGDRVGELQGELRSILHGVQLDTSDTARFDEVGAWIEDLLPGLRRRLALARNLDDSTNTPQPDTPEVHLPIVEIDDESLLPDCPPVEAYQNGRDAAERFSVPEEQKPATRQMVADLRTGQHDPYFAKEFVHNTDPNDVVRVVLHATSADEGDSGGQEDLIQMTASTVATGSRSTGELAPPAGYEEQWAALRDSDDPETAALAAKLRPAPQG